MRKILLTAAVVAGGLTISGGVAAAQSYDTTTTVASTTTTTVAGSTPTTIAVGSTTTVQDCTFGDGSTVSAAIDGTPDGTDTSSGTGCVTGSLAATDPHLAFGSGPAISVGYGVNTLTLTGNGPDGVAHTDTYTITIPEAAVPSTSLAFTGADIAATVAGGLALIGAGSILLLAVRRRRLA